MLLLATTFSGVLEIQEAKNSTQGQYNGSPQFPNVKKTKKKKPNRDNETNQET